MAVTSCIPGVMILMAVRGIGVWVRSRMVRGLSAFGRASGILWVVFIEGMAAALLLDR
jgi:hypothetical protein